MLVSNVFKRSVDVTCGENNQPGKLRQALF